MARLRNAIQKTDIPSWFVLSKYAFASDLDSAGWYEQILAREQLFLMMEQRKNSGRPLSEEDLVSRLASETWLEAKVSFKGSGILPSICGHDGAVGRISSSYAKSVHSLTYRQFLQQDEGIRSESEEKARQWWENISAPDFGRKKNDMDLAYEVMEFVD
ncbi:hypothetical protein [Pseudomonas syringae]|uniref:hypothetical protein n=1 Tax=Pseudomonas syringae TaxID=317 RepID=UPI001F1D07C8|nr:hypothetical protein [Pseudomonas syringae]MCF5725266.1 hypothetical protein [Pseudomonas syringae]